MKSAWQVLTGERRRRRVMVGVLILTCIKALVIMAVYLRSLNYESRGYLFFPSKLVVAPLPAGSDIEPTKKKGPEPGGKSLERLKEELSTKVEEYRRIKKELKPGP